MAVTSSTGITSSPFDGKPLLYRSSHTAESNFGLGNTLYDKVPRSKFLFYCRFVRNNSTTANSTSSANNWDDNLGIIIKDVDRPAITFDTQTLNQYNKKRIIQTKVEYGNFTLKMHHTVNNIAFSMFQEYFRFYYGDARITSDQLYTHDIINEQMQIPTTGYWGYNPPETSSNNTYFFSHIEIYEIYGGYYNQFNLIHPKIISYNPDSLNYSESGLSEISMQLQYEGVTFVENNASLTSQLISTMGLSNSSFYEPETGPITTDGLSRIDLSGLSSTGSNVLDSLLGINSGVNINQNNVYYNSNFFTTNNNLGNGTNAIISNVGGNLNYNTSTNSTGLVAGNSTANTNTTPSTGFINRTINNLTNPVSNLYDSIVNSF